MSLPLKILILEDVRFDVELIERELKKAKIDFVSKNAFTQADFIEAIDEFGPDIILSDHSMPQFNSFDALNIFKKKKLNIPFILVTGAVSEEFAVKILKEGADDYILKGNLIRLPSAIQNALKQKQAETERKSAIKKLKRSEEHFRSLIENATDIINILDSSLSFTYVSPSIERILGYKASEILHKNISSFIHPNDFELCYKEFKKESSESSFVITYRLRHSNGHWLDIESTGKSYIDEKGRKSYIINSRDITDRKRIEEKLKYKIKELDTLIYMYSHDLKGPFCSLQGFVNIAKLEVKDKTAAKYIGMIETTTKKLDAILMNLVQITMINREAIKITNVNIKSLIQDSINKFEILPEFSEIEFILDIDPKENFPSDPKLLQSILENLIYNSIVFRRQDIDNSYVKINSFIKNDHLVLSVKDNGAGIPFEIQGEVFDMFFRGSYASKGSGLGLYIVKNAVEKLGGHIELKSSLGNGTEFIIDLPFIEANELELDNNL